MVQNALGLIETVGLVAAIEAADAAVKAANIQLVGYELTRGGGMTVIKLSGDVGAVTAAVAAGKAAAEKVGRVWTAYIIPRPHQETGSMIYTRETVGTKKKQNDAASDSGSPILAQQAECELPLEQEIAVETRVPDAVQQEPEQTDIGDGETSYQIKKSNDICNLCGDPVCPRKKGDPKITCIHYDKTIREDE
jgi:microcompartment protein CcmL/EutN